MAGVRAQNGRMWFPSDVRRTIWLSACLTSHLAKSPRHAPIAAIRERPFPHDHFGVRESPFTPPSNQKAPLSWATLDCVTTVYLLTLSRDTRPLIMLKWLHRASG